MMDIDRLIAAAGAKGASDVHLREGMPPMIRVDGELTPTDAPPLTDEQIRACVSFMLRSKRPLGEVGSRDMDFCHVAENGTRVRVNVYMQNNHVSAALRLLSERIPTIEELSLSPVLHQLCRLPRGLVLVTGPTGSGKSTTLAAMMDEINRERPCHILTVEDPVEYKYTPKRALINQRELGSDVPDFATALKSALREDPDVILVGEMRDLETISAAITAAETGHLVFSTLHTAGAANTIDRIVDVFPAAQQPQVRTQLASVLRAVMTQQLLPRINGGRIAAMELMLVTDAIANMIREDKCHQIGTALQTGVGIGMCSTEFSLAALVKQGLISQDAAMAAANDRAALERYIGVRAPRA